MGPQTRRVGAIIAVTLLTVTAAWANPDVEAADTVAYALLAIPLLLLAIVAIEVLVFRLLLRPPHVWRTVLAVNVLSAFIGVGGMLATGFAQPARVPVYVVAYVIEIGLIAYQWSGLGLRRVLATAVAANVVSTLAFFFLLLPGWSALADYEYRWPRLPLEKTEHWGPEGLSYRARSSFGDEASPVMGFVDAEHGWLRSVTGEFLLTTDGGRRWEEHPNSADAIQFAGAQVGWAARRGAGLRPSDEIGRSHDGGRTWRWHSVGQVAVTALAAVDDREAWAATLSGEWPIKGPAPSAQLLHTRDEGRTWQPVAIPRAGQVCAAAALDRDHAWFVADPVGGAPDRVSVSLTVLSTSDGGRTFNAAQTPPVTVHGDTRRVHFVSAREGWIAAESDVLLHTRDGGATWEIVRPDPARAMQTRLLDCWFLAPRVGWAAGYLRERGTGRALLLVTRDGGQTWRHVVTGAEKLRNGYFDGVVFLDADYGWLSGGKGDEPYDYPPFHTTQFVLRYRP